MARIVGPINSGAAVGSAGSATANASSTKLISGAVLGVYVKYNDSPPATTDVTIKTVGTSPAAPSLTFLTLTDANTSGYFYPRVQVHDTAGAALTYDGTRAQVIPPIIHDLVNITIAQANAADSVDVWLILQ